MAHRYSMPIGVEVGTDGTPLAFTWRGERYPVLHVLSVWKLRDHWWVHPVEVALGHEANGPSVRQYFRLLVPDQQVFEVYHDSISHVWVLDVVQD